MFYHKTSDILSNTDESLILLDYFHTVYEANISGDFATNAHNSNLDCLRSIVVQVDDQLLCADMEFLGSNSDTFTFMSDAHGSRRWLDHCLTTYAAWDTVTKVQVDYNGQVTVFNLLVIIYIDQVVDIG
ncbi:unnamed protein product [Leptidea sinapis]|uniref:Uncharacterized protein n=1 Tax=Leptidea sinapis TaxID=189913 RepID=A0A5E4QN23_9NEOP|nr:unnamed protein product [Leptidea sinapis]